MLRTTKSSHDTREYEPAQPHVERAEVERIGRAWQHPVSDRRQGRPPVGRAVHQSVTEPGNPDLAVVVLALGAPLEAVAAVGSLLAQDPAVEIVVVNSGGGGMAGVLTKAGVAVPVIEREERLFVGGARNLGIHATKAPYIGFLAADCVAAPGWARYRLEAHRAGHRAVSTALLNYDERSVVAWAAYLALHHRRLPSTPARSTGRYGVSYARSLFDQYGVFREDLRVMEDTEFNQRLRPEDTPFWEPRVQTSHRHPTRLSRMMAEFYRRGRRDTVAWQEVLGRPMPSGLKTMFARTRNAIRFFERGRQPRLMARLSYPLIPVALGAYYLGAAGRGASRRGRADHPAQRH
jgi:glycosyltransferase involved in cell wall biosynthesis